MTVRDINVKNSAPYALPGKHGGTLLSDLCKSAAQALKAQQLQLS